MKITQKQEVLNRLQMGEWFSLGDALSMNPPIYRLSERIREIEQMGFTVEHDRVPDKPYARYRLVPTQGTLI